MRRNVRRNRRSTQIVETWLDDEVWGLLAAEATVMGDADEFTTINRRLNYAAWAVGLIDAGDLRWKPTRANSFVCHLEIDRDVLCALQDFADRCDYSLQVVIATILVNDACKPPDVTAQERAHAAGRPRALRWEQGRGNIYPARFDVPGYQLIFIKLLSPSVTKRDGVFEEALMALARQVQHVNQVAGMEVSDEARAFARKMINWPSR